MADIDGNKKADRDYGPGFDNDSSPSSGQSTGHNDNSTNGNNDNSKNRMPDFYKEADQDTYQNHRPKTPLAALRVVAAQYEKILEEGKEKERKLKKGIELLKALPTTTSPEVRKTVDQGRAEYGFGPVDWDKLDKKAAEDTAEEIEGLEFSSRLNYERTVKELDRLHAIIDKINTYRRSHPILLDLDGNGVQIAQLSQSGKFFDTAGDGYQHRTAWAGTGDAVLAIDADGNNVIDQKNEIVFTDWDPTAKTDMQALRDVFDTDHDGDLDKDDAKFAQFRLVVTNADGTTSVQSLATDFSLNLIENAVEIVDPDGSAITGQTTFSGTVNGKFISGGTAATVSLATEAQGYALDHSQSTVGTVTTIIDKARNARKLIEFLLSPLMRMKNEAGRER